MHGDFRALAPGCLVKELRRKRRDASSTVEAASRRFSSFAFFAASGVKGGWTFLSVQAGTKIHRGTSGVPRFAAHGLQGGRSIHKLPQRFPAAGASKSRGCWCFTPCLLCPFTF